jgi:hypothetical protein
MKKKLAELEQVAEEHLLFKQYISSEIRARKKDLKLNPEKKWNDKTIVIIDVIPKDKGESKEVYVNIWEVPLKISIMTEGSKIYFKVENFSDNKTICDINVICILVNRQPSGQNHVIVKNGEFHKYGQYRSFEILETYTINQISSGYILNGKIGIVAQVFMSEPNKMYR